MTSTAFEQFLADNNSRMLQLEQTSVEVFEPDAAVREGQIEAAEKRLGVTLPTSYRTFVRVCGSGRWCGDNTVVAPDDVYTFDHDCGDMKGFVTLVHNVRGVGDYVGMNPREQTGPGEWALYYCSHDPFGYGKIADSFESWAREALAAFERGEDMYDKATDDVWRTYRSHRAKTKQWWQFWR